MSSGSLVLGFRDIVGGICARGVVRVPCYISCIRFGLLSSGKKAAALWSGSHLLQSESLLDEGNTFIEMMHVLISYVQSPKFRVVKAFVLDGMEESHDVLIIESRLAVFAVHDLTLSSNPIVGTIGSVEDIISMHVGGLTESSWAGLLVSKSASRILLGSLQSFHTSSAQATTVSVAYTMLFRHETVHTNIASTCAQCVPESSAVSSSTTFRYRSNEDRAGCTHKHSTCVDTDAVALSEPRNTALIAEIRYHSAPKTSNQASLEMHHLSECPMVRRNKLYGKQKKQLTRFTPRSKPSSTISIYEGANLAVYPRTKPHLSHFRQSQVAAYASAKRIA